MLDLCDMSAPRCVLPGTTYLLTRRCSERRFFLRPSPKVNAILLYCLALAARRFGVLIHAFCFLSNHVHLVATDERGELPLFMHLFDQLSARALNCLFGRFEALWAPGTYSAVALADADAVLEKIAYTLANPVAAGLVRRGADWPGLRSRPTEWGTLPRPVRRPPRFFRRERSVALPAEVELTLTAPPALVALPPAELQATIAARVEAHEARARATHDAAGRTVIGRRRVRKQSIYDRPRSHEARFGLNPRVAGRDKWKRIEALQRLRAFRRAYHEALARWREGLREVVFPAGTWLLRRLLGVVTAAAPS